MLALFFACQAPEPAVDGPLADDTGAVATTPPTGDSIDDAVPLVADAADEAIDPAGDVDYWSIELDEGAFVEVYAETVEGDPDDADFACDGTYDEDPLDTVVLVYDPDGNEILAADEWYRGICGRDARGLFRAPASGTYTLAVTDWNAWDRGGGMFGNPPAGGPEYTYTLHVAAHDAVEAGGALPDAAPVVVLDGEDAWDLSVATRTWLTVQHPSNTNAGTGDLVLEVDDADGERLALWTEDAFYGTRWGVGVTVPVDPGEYVVRVWDTDGVDAADDWYWLWTDSDDTYAANPEVEPNESRDVATALVPRAGDGQYEGDYVQAQFDGRLAAGDTDTFVVPVTEGQYVYLSLYSSAVGSPADVAVAMVDVDGATELASDAGGFVSLTRERPSADGDLAVVVTADDDAYYLGYLEVWDSRRPW